MKDGFVLSACAVPQIRVADTAHNAAEAVRLTEAAHAKGVKLLVFPALNLTGATAGDLFLQQTLLRGAQTALATVTEATRGKRMLVFVGLPVSHRGNVYNCTAAIHNGQVLGLSVLEDGNGRYFSRAPKETETIQLFGGRVPLGRHLIFTAAELPSFSVAVYAKAANILVRPYASFEVVGSAQHRRTDTVSNSASLAAGIVQTGAGAGESTSDCVYAGHSLIAENGRILAESDLFCSGLTALCEIDTAFIENERRVVNRSCAGEDATYIEFSCPMTDAPLYRKYKRLPFVPEDKAELKTRAACILEIQAQGLYKRMRHTGAKSMVLGVSGGLDSTLALFVCLRVAALLGEKPDSVIKAYTMPCFGTGKRTRQNAETLCNALGVTLESIDITASVRAHFADIGQSESAHDVTFENAQARMRTMVLMDKANQTGGLVVGTGDLSEAALGFSTYNGDHMSMYNVNASVPKTLIGSILRCEADRLKNKSLQAVVSDILDTPVSPELLPAKEGIIVQATESIVGPYALHDFFIYHTLRRGATPQKLVRLAAAAFEGVYTRDEVIAWLTVFYKRFFSQQFKRSCAPDAPKVGSVSFSPEDWRMPGDASSALWLEALKGLEQNG